MSASPDLPSARLHQWLLDEAYPLWCTVGVDPNGGFAEKIDAEGRPVPGPRRARVLARQIYSFARAPVLGWTGDAGTVVRHGLKALPTFLREDGLAEGWVDDQGVRIPGPIDLYDQAFFLFGLAHALPFAEDLETVIGTARRMREALRAHAHPDGGYREPLPLKANPHMHLFEAGLAWGEVEGRPDGAAWDAFTDDIGELALRRFIDPAGAVHEFYDADWSRMTGEQAVVEPGHQFEWGWLLIRWGLARGRSDAVAAGERLIALGEAHGVDARSRMAAGELNGDLTPRPFHTRLWPQCERIKAWAQAAMRAPDAAAREAALAKMEAASEALERFLDASPRGAWRDRMDEARTIREEPAPASSLYHIVGAVEEAARARGRI